MPRARRTKRRVGRKSRRRVRGGSKIWGFLKKANKWLRKTGAISKGTRFLANNTKMPYVGKIAKYSKQLGYGCGGSLRLAGQGGGSLGYGRRRRVVRRRRRR